MSLETPRMRMFAGPNGSGKSTIKSVINPSLLGIYINPDDIEADIAVCGFLDFPRYSVQTSKEEALKFFADSALLKKEGLLEEATCLRFNDDKLIFHDVGVNAYFASVVSDFLRVKLIESGQSFTFETVMSSSDKIEVLRKAQSRGFRTYLYYVATEDPEINISRIQYRVQTGGHSVPADKIKSRYSRSLDLLIEAVRLTNRAYIFDNSSHEHIWLAEITNGKELEMKSDQMPEWFKKALWAKLKEVK
jgi:predicted ABC-type ATPase